MVDEKQKVVQVKKKWSRSFALLHRSTTGGIKKGAEAHGWGRGNSKGSVMENGQGRYCLIGDDSQTEDTRKC